MAKSKLPRRRFRLVYEGRDLSLSPLSEEGKFEAFQLMSQWFDEGREGAIDPDDVEVIEVTEEQ
jgi:hypothetical protein